MAALRGILNRCNSSGYSSCLRRHRPAPRGGSSEGGLAPCWFRGCGGGGTNDSCGTERMGAQEGLFIMGNDEQRDESRRERRMDGRGQCCRCGCVRCGEGQVTRTIVTYARPLPQRDNGPASWLPPSLPLLHPYLSLPSLLPVSLSRPFSLPPPSHPPSSSPSPPVPSLY